MLYPVKVAFTYSHNHSWILLGQRLTAGQLPPLAGWLSSGAPARQYQPACPPPQTASLQAVILRVEHHRLLLCKITACREAVCNEGQAG